MRREPVRIDWAPGGARTTCCPVCDSDAPKPVWLQTNAAPDGRWLPLLRCPACDGAFRETRVAPPYDQAGRDPTILKFYLEQSIDIATGLMMLLRLPSLPPRSCLEIGCGFGFALDFARFAFGWPVRGVDPSPIAAAGARALDLDVDVSYFDPAAPTEGVRPDVILFSEVLEHVADPQHFVQGLRRHVARDGALALTTPNAAALHAGRDDGSVLSMVCPAHLVLFSPRSLEILLRRAGFEHVRVWSEGDRLDAVASHRRLDLREAAPLDGTLYRRYLTHRAERAPVGSSLAVGLDYRLFKELVCASDLAGAAEPYARLRVAYQERYGLDIADPDSWSREPAPEDFDELAHRRPFNLTGVFFYQGIVALNRDRDIGHAEASFRAAAASGSVLRAVLQRRAWDDGETADLVRQAERHQRLCVSLRDALPADTPVTRPVEGAD